jgi:Arc/MetJ family transcription regulator
VLLKALEEASFDAITDACRGGYIVRTTITLDDDLLATAQAFTGLQEKSAPMREVLKPLIEREGARRLARLGGSGPDLKPVWRRQTNQA